MKARAYNHAWTAPYDTTVAILSIGYSDGLFRSSSFQGVEVLIHGQRRPLIGAMCMDQCLVDLGTLPAAIGEEVVVIGIQGSESISALEVAEKTGTIVPETLSMLRGRMPRHSRLIRSFYPKKNSQAAGFVLMEFLQNPVIVRVFLFSVFSDFHVF